MSFFLVPFQDLHIWCGWMHALIPDLNAPGLQMSTITEYIGQRSESDQEELSQKAIWVNNMKKTSSIYSMKR